MTMGGKTSGGDIRPGLVTAGWEIEQESFRIIDAEMGEHSFSADQWPLVRRIIHTTGDFDFARQVRFHPRAVAAGVAALQNEAAIITDTRMIQVGLSTWRLQWFGNRVVTPMTDPETQALAKDLGTTRSVAAFRHHRQQLDGAIVAIGNAPTAVLEVLRSISEDGVRPALVIGVPVGFVQAVEAKEALWQMQDQPSITCLGRKGGSPVAVAVLHALLELARDQRR
jgi:precorrin-8X/cobalt-precorrin-8 methylmutase